MLLAAAAPATPARLDVGIDGLRSPKGLLLACLTRDAAYFPNCKADPAAIRLRVPAADPHVRFDNVPPGDYALSLIHDENGNGRLDTRLGVPREGIAFSRNPRLMFGPPNFGAARFTVSHAGSGQSVRVKYFL